MADPQVTATDDIDLKFRLSFSKAVNLDNTSDVVVSTALVRATSLEAAASDFHILDIFIALYDKDFAPLGFVEWILGDEAALMHASPGRLGQDFDLSISTDRIVRSGQAGQSSGETYAVPLLANGARSSCCY